MTQKKRKWTVPDISKITDSRELEGIFAEMLLNIPPEEVEDAVLNLQEQITRGRVSILREGEKRVDHFGDDENVKAMRETARVVGLIQLLIDIARSPAVMMGVVDTDRLGKALGLLGVEESDWKS